MACGGCKQGISVNIEKAEVLKAPVMNPDGSIQYPEDQEVPVIEGYTLDEDDDHRLIPDVACGCVYKITGILMQKDGTFKPHHVCRHSQCEHNMKPVTFDICESCPLRQQG